jgi:membrane protein DedA with SNARE-associated domain
MNAVLHWFCALTSTFMGWGYSGIYLALVVEGLGLPFPGDMVMGFYGLTVAKGNFHLLGVIAVSILGYLTGAVLSYFVSRRYGTHLVNRISVVSMLSERSMTRTARLIDRYGPILLVPGRFLPGVRSVSSYVAGLSRMDFGAFLLYTVIGVSLWCTAWVGLGYWFGENLQAILRFTQSWLVLITVTSLVLIAGIWWYRRKLLG